MGYGGHELHLAPKLMRAISSLLYLFLGKVKWEMVPKFYYGRNIGWVTALDYTIASPISYFLVPSGTN